jgi:thiol-disulfide isomerase/thioredoxin
MNLLRILLLLLLTPFCFSQNQELPSLKKGRWIGRLQLNQEDDLFFEMHIGKENKNYVFTVINGSEEIAMAPPKVTGDSLTVSFPYFNSALIFSVDSRKLLKGYWKNYDKVNYTIPFSATASRKNNRFPTQTKKSTTLPQVEGRWEVSFSAGKDSEYPGVGIFEQNEEVVTGTFLTETGDYRFLAGNRTTDSLYLSCFDGTHAFLFKAKFTDSGLTGSFNSGSHWKSNWIASRNDTIELKSPETLTYLKKDSTVSFELMDLKGQPAYFPNESTKGKVTIIQIMGTWCPNCLDETMYYKKLYDRYHNQGLEVISVCYEVGATFDSQVESIERLKNKLNLDFTFLVGGDAKKSLASQHFNMLNEIISFPTSIFIGRDGEVKRVHTGFNGPGTGDVYTSYMEKTNALIESLLAQ